MLKVAAMSPLNSLRPWREIAKELLREPNTGRMAALMKELNEAFNEDERLADQRRADQRLAYNEN